MTQTTPTCLWNDSADLDELAFAIEQGGVGATCNPVIAHTVLKTRLAEWRPRIAALMRELPRRHRRRDRVGGGRATVDRRGAAARPAFDDAPRPQRPAVDPDRSASVSAIASDSSNRRERFDRAGAQHDRQDSRDRAPASRPSKQPPRWASASTPPCASRCRSAWRSPKRSSAGCGRREAARARRLDHGPGVHDHGRAGSTTG